MGLKYKDFVGIIKPTVHIDEFSSKIAGDDEIVVLSFYVTNEQVTDDLVLWFEKGYSWIIDADRSPGEIKPNRYLVFVEIKRRTDLIDQLEELLTDLETLTEHKLMDWKITHDETEIKFDGEALDRMLDLSPHSYREHHEEELNEMRTAANLPVKPNLIGRDKDLDVIRAQAGLL